MSHEQLLRSGAAPSLVGTAAQHADDALARPHPYPAWQPTAAGDPNALLPWIDHDLEGHDAVLDAPPRPRRDEPERSEFAKPARTTKRVVEDVERAKRVAEGAEWLEHGALHTASQALAPVLGPLGMASGAVEIAEGISEARDGHGVDGALDIASGAAGVGSSGAGMASLLVAGAIPWAVGLGAAEDGMEVGHYGDKQVKELGRLHDSEGNATTASRWAGDTARDVHDWFADRGHPVLGHVAGVPTLAGTTVIAGGLAVEAAAESEGRAAGGWLGRRSRVNHYNGYDMNLVGGAESFAHYDDTQEAAIERTKREHPERWGHNPNNLTPDQAFAHLIQLAEHGKGS
ncbi:MAG: hypothetical protein ACM31C_34370 [Acidobacteriota bacterium]